MSDLNKSDKNIAKALDAQKQAESNEIRLSTGVILTAKQANPNVLIRIMTAVPRPKPPVYFDEMMGREMENPDHPDYKKQVDAWEMQYNNGMLNALVGLGTELKSLPKGTEGPFGRLKETIVCEHCGANNKPKEQSCSKCGAPLPLAEEAQPRWLADYRALGLPVVPDSKAWRYITWVLFVAAVNDSDTKAIMEKVKALSGVREADVQAAETFPDGDST